MAAFETSLEEAFAQEIDEIARNEDVQFATKQFLFVHKYSCRTNPKRESCISEGRELYTQFVHGVKLARTRAFACMGKCKEDSCYAECKNNLAEKVVGLYQPLTPTLDDFLLKFAKH
jgi:hypothetical protein